VLAVDDSLEYGIPAGWTTQLDVEYYTGRRRDIHGNLIGQEFAGKDFAGVAVSDADPPRYESQGAYLARLNLLSEVEKKWLAEHPAAPEEVEIVTLDGDDT
jgi:hypothetical protein